MKSTKKSIEEFAEAHELDILFADGFEECIIGLGQCFDKYQVIYDRDKVIKCLMKSMSEDEAEYYFKYNILCSYVGEATPIFTVSLGEDL